MKTILIVEDDKQYQNLLKEKLTQEGFSVITADNGKQGLDYLLYHDADLILLDVLMPDIDGITFLYNLHFSLMKKIPVIVLTNLEKATYLPEVRDFLLKANTSLADVVTKVKTYAH